MELALPSSSVPLSRALEGRVDKELWLRLGRSPGSATYEDNSHDCLAVSAHPSFLQSYFHGQEGPRVLGMRLGAPMSFFRGFKSNFARFSEDRDNLGCLVSLSHS